MEKKEDNIEKKIEDKLEVLKSTKARFQHLLAYSPSVLFSFKPQKDFVITFISENIKELLGYEPEKFIDNPQSWIDCVHPEDLPILLSQLPDLLEKGFIVSEYRFKHIDGTYRWLHDKKRVYYDTNGQPLEIIGSWIDITERKKAEEKLKESEEKYRELFENSPNSIILLNLKGEVIDCNSRVLRLSNFKREELIGKKFTEFSLIPKENLPFLIKKFKTLLKEKKHEPYETYFYKKDGSIVWLYANSSLIKINDETVIQLILKNITNRKETELKLKESENSLRKRVNELNCLYGISKLIEKEEISVDEIIQETLEFVPAAFQTPNLVCARILLNGKEYKTSNFRETEHKIATHVKIRDKLLDIEAYYLNGYQFLEEEIYFLYDIAIRLKNLLERKESEQNLKKSKQKYEEAYNRMMVYQYLIAHDINNILNNIKASTQLFILYQNEPEKIANRNELIEIIKDQSLRGGNLIKNVRKLSQLEEGNLKLDKVEINEILNQAIKYLHKSFPSKTINIQVNSYYETIYILANELLFDVFENILNNAVKYNNNPSVEILVKISKEKRENRKFVKLEFIDNGIGISDVKKQLIFQKTFIKDSYEKGMGLGLSLVKKIIQSYNGKIWVENRVEDDYTKGSNFIVLIPEI